MKAYYDIAQGSADWHRLRMGIPTASCFDQIITPVKGDLSKSWRRYAYRLIAERLLNAPTESVEGVEWMERGRELEPVAAKQYEFVQEVETVPVGFITTDDGLLGCSPDRLVKGKPIGVEIKCARGDIHLAYLIDGTAPEYRPQVQGQMLVAELERVDLYPYHPRMPSRPIETPRDEPYISLLRDRLDEFNIGLIDMLERARALGVFQAYESAATPLDIERADELDRQFRRDFGIATEAGFG